MDSLGWNDGAFVLPTGENIGTLGKAVRFAGETPGDRCKALGGTLKGWQKEEGWPFTLPWVQHRLCLRGPPSLNLVRSFAVVPSSQNKNTHPSTSSPASMKAQIRRSHPLKPSRQKPLRSETS